MTWHGNGMSLVITLCLLTVFIILSLDIGTVNLEDKFFEISSSQVFNNTYLTFGPALKLAANGTLSGDEAEETEELVFQNLQ